MGPGTIEGSLRSYMTQKRFRHTLGVRETALLLAKAYNCNQEKAVIASLLHDVARDMPLRDMQALVLEKTHSHTCSGEVLGNPLLLHAPAGCAIARRDFHIRDEEILRSIELHTTGGGSMSLLDKIIFVADYIEPGRKFRGVKTARLLARRSLDAAVLYIFKSVLRLLLSRDRYICEASIGGYNELVLEKAGGR